MEAQLESTHIACTFGADLYPQSVLVNNISASELSQKLIKSALLVGHSQRHTADKNRYFFLTMLCEVFSVRSHTTKNSQHRWTTGATATEFLFVA